MLTIWPINYHIRRSSGSYTHRCGFPSLQCTVHFQMSPQIGCYTYWCMVNGHLPWCSLTWPYRSGPADIDPAGHIPIAVAWPGQTMLSSTASGNRQVGRQLSYIGYGSIILLLMQTKDWNGGNRLIHLEFWKVFNLRLTRICDFKTLTHCVNLKNKIGH